MTKALERPDGPHAFIQWKGTDACADLWCECGAWGHYDGDFMYCVQCSECGRTYDVGCFVRLFPSGGDHEPIVVDMEPDPDADEQGDE